MARRYLSLDPESWDQLPWWQQRMYLEGYEWEGLVEASNGASTDPNTVSQKVHYEGSNKITDTETAETFSLVPGEVQAAGFTEMTME